MPRELYVVGVGGNLASWQTLSWAVSEATASGARLVIGHACRPDSPLARPGGELRLAALELADPALARAFAAARSRLGGERVQLVVRPEPAGDLLVRLAGTADLLVVGAPTRSGWAERRSTTHHVVQHSPCPVVVVRPLPRPTPGLARPFAGHVVAGVDGSTPARAALEFGFGYAAAHHAPLAAVNVAPHIDHDIWYDETYLETHLASEPAALALLAEEVEPWQHKYPGVPVKRALFAGRALDGLVRAAEGAVLLVVGACGGGAVPTGLLGSVSHAAVDHARCVVAVVHGDERTMEVPQ